MNQPEFSKNYTGRAYSSMRLQGNNYIGCIKLLSHLVGREDREREPEERLLRISERKGWSCHACLRACVTISLAQFYRNGKLDPGEDRTSQNILSKVYEVKQNNSLRSQEVPNGVSLGNCTELQA